MRGLGKHGRRSQGRPVAPRGGTVWVRGIGVVLGLLCGVTAQLVVAAAPALALTEMPQWSVTAVSAPTNFAPGSESGKDFYRVIVKNTGGAAAGCTKAQYEAEAAAQATPLFCSALVPRRIRSRSLTYCRRA